MAYFNGPNRVKINATFYGESGKAAEDYYYWEGKLIFILRTDYAYSKPLSGKVVRTEVSRFYFNNDKLIRRLDEIGQQVAPETSEYTEKQKEYLDNSKLFTDGARSKKQAIESAQQARRRLAAKKQNEARKLKNSAPRALVLANNHDRLIDHRCGNCEKITKCPPGSFTTISFAPYELS